MTTKKAPNPPRLDAWPAGEPLHERLMRCVLMLSIHGILPQSERDKACKRIRKVYARTLPEGPKP